MTDYKRLRELAEAATPGPWQNRSTIMPGDPPRLIVFRSVPEPGWSQQAIATTHVDQPAVKMDQAYTDAAFIACANPTAVLALLDEIEELRAVRNQLAALATRFTQAAQIGEEASRIYAEYIAERMKVGQ